MNTEKGILLVNKPIGYSTFDIIRDFKRGTSFKGKIGHAGTLDVFAQGLAILLVNTTKDFAKFQELQKHYQANVRLGISSSTLDVEGEFTPQKDTPQISREQLLETLPNFVGTYEQTIPSYSAAKFEGKPLYKHAREGNLISHKSKPATIHSFELIAYKYPVATLGISCSSGTYIRQLTYDLFQKLNLDSFLFGLTRTQIGKYQLKNAAPISSFSDQTWQNYLISIE
jgi:tRNA pseudouridine55 synthase